MMDQPTGPPQRGGTLRNILIWTYERGTFPYDILCGLILAFVFFVPRSCFAPKRPADSGQTTQVSSQESPTQRTVPHDAKSGN